MRAVREDLRGAIVADSVDNRAVAACLRVVEIVGPVLQQVPDVRFASFAEERGVTLLIHSKTAKRQVSFEVSPAGKAVCAVTIDEQMERAELFVAPDDRPRIRECVAWLRGHS